MPDNQNSSDLAQRAYEAWRDTPPDGGSQWPKWEAVVAALTAPAMLNGVEGLVAEWREEAAALTEKCNERDATGGGRRWAEWLRGEWTAGACALRRCANQIEALRAADNRDAAGVHSECCDTPAYCSSVRRCTRLDTPTAAPAGVDALVAKDVQRVMADGDGFWTPCSGCYETEDGHPVGEYPYSSIFQCALGGGCRECGGLGAVWDNTDYDPMAESAISADPTPTAAPAGEAVARERTLPVEIHGAMYEVPIRVQLHIVHLNMKLDAIGRTKGAHPILDLLSATEHCLSAAEEGVDYCVARPMLDAMTTLGLLEKVGRGKWAPTEAAERFATLAAHPPAAEVREVVPDPTLLRFYEATDYPSLVDALEDHVLKLIDTHKRNVKPWEDTFPPTLLPKWAREQSPVFAKGLDALAGSWQDEAAGSWGETPEHATLQRCCDQLRAHVTAALSPPGRAEGDGRDA